MRVVRVGGDGCFQDMGISLMAVNKVTALMERAAGVNLIKAQMSLGRKMILTHY